MMQAATVKSVLCLLAIACLVQAPLLADGPQTGTIDGTVTDAQGGGLPGVTVTLTGPQNTRTEMTDEEGKYRFALLQAGAYVVNATLEGLGTAERAVALEMGQRHDVALSAGSHLRDHHRHRRGGTDLQVRHRRHLYDPGGGTRERHLRHAQLQHECPNDAGPGNPQEAGLCPRFS